VEVHVGIWKLIFPASASRERYPAIQNASCSVLLASVYNACSRWIRMSIAPQQRRAETGRVSIESPLGDAKWLETALWFSGWLSTWTPKRASRNLAKSADWNPGVSIVVLQLEWPASAIDHCVQALLRSAPEISEPFEVIVLMSDHQPGVSGSGVTFRVRWLPAVAGCGFASGVQRALLAARFDWIYLLDAGIEIEPRTLVEALQWRAPHLFAIGSQIVGSASSGWNDARIVGDVVVPFAASPDQSGLTRGNLYADGRAALFRRETLRALLPRRDPYLGPRWNDVEWGIRAWRAGYEVLFCPGSRVHQWSEAPAQAATARRRDQLQLDLRNAWTSVPPKHLAEMASQGDAQTHAGLWKAGNVCRIFLSRLRANAAPVRELPWSHLRSKCYPVPWRRGDARPRVLVAAPYALFPPTHGGAHRIHRLLEHIARRYRVILLSDEGESYGDASAPYLAQLEAVHFVGGRKEAASADAMRIARVRSHSRELLGNELSRVLKVYRPDLVQIEYVELALLAQRREGRTPWILTLHDCLLSGALRPSEKDRFEREWIGKFDHLIACCEEDASLLRDMPVSVVPNGAAIHDAGYIASAGLSDLLFLGPFRYQPNWDGIHEFLLEAYPALHARIPGVRLHILGGVDASSRAGGSEAFRQPGVYVHDHVDDVTPWLKACALTVNPIRNNRGSCLKVAESLAAGRVCVSTREGARGFLDAGLRSLVVVDTVSQFTDAIAGLLNDEKTRLRLEAPETGNLAGYSWTHSAEMQMGIYERLTGGRSRKTGGALSRAVGGDERRGTDEDVGPVVAQSPVATSRVGRDTGDTDFLAARSPRILWIELTSKCPFDCIFCSRQVRRGAGRHLPFEVYSSLLKALVDPRKFLLNYSGESTVYPDLVPAIQMARGTGASVEMVTAMATAPESLLGPLSQSGLNRLTVSIHATDTEKFAQIYRYSSFATLRSRLERFLELCRGSSAPPVVDLAFVAMDSNLAELPSVASLATELELHEITVFPVMRRDEIPAEFVRELTPHGARRPEFERRMQAVVNETAQSHPEIRFLVNEPLTTTDGCLGTVPAPYAGELPGGAMIHTCEQNPWETAHVLSNGDVVACEVLDKLPLGNLSDQSIDEIWHGHAYQSFRQRYRRGEVSECRKCPWKRAYLPEALASEIIARRGLSAQLLYGWHAPSGEEHIWSSQQAAAVLAPVKDSRMLHLSGMLPAGPPNSPNHLTIKLNGTEVGQVTNPWEEIMPFGLDFEVAANQKSPWMIEFRTAHLYRPSERGVGTDQRDLGFALVLVVSKASAESENSSNRNAALQPLRRSVQAMDLWGNRMRRRMLHAERAQSSETWNPGLSILIPEWDNAQELTACLESVQEAATEWSEPLEVVVVVNGSPRSGYQTLRKAHPKVIWRFYDRPLGFGGAIRAGLGAARHDWVYLLNSDVVLEQSALRVLAPLRSRETFSIASQIVLKDRTRFRDETNWATLLVESGLATIHDWIPKSEAPVSTFYSGGGASMFRTCLLRKLLDALAYDPFYWEDVEWGWRARKLGYTSWHCPGSIAHHTRRSTIGRHYSPETVEQIIRRNGLLFQLRNFTTAGSLERVLEEIASAPQTVGEHFLAPATRWKIARGRWWNHLAPLGDEEVFARWNNSVSNC